MAVGNYLTSKDGKTLTLTEAWDGTSWAVVPSPNATNTNQLLSVSCTGPSFCMAVGDDVPVRGRMAGETLAEVWDGSAWSLLPTPDPSTIEDFLNGVSCTSASECMAVGYDQENFSLDPLFESWNGTTWSVADTDPSAVGLLVGVSCTSASACMAVGDLDLNGTVADVWDGTSWSPLSTPNPPGTGEDGLSGVSCTDASDCTAVGFYVDALQRGLTLAEKWNGTVWSVVRSPSPTPGAPKAGLNELYGAACAAPSQCMAVGSYVDRVGLVRTLAEQWSGSTWSLAKSPDPTLSSFLIGVSCPSASQCTAVGWDQVSVPNFPRSYTLIEQWNGTNWSTVPSPSV
jgi:hypothetical protein